MQYKYMFIKQWIIDQINSGVFQPGDALPSEYELCQQFSVSRQTARNALDMLVSQGIIQREQGRGTFVKSTLNRNRNNTVGVLLSYANEYLFPDLLCSIENVLTSHRFGIDLGITYNQYERERRFLERMLDANISGLLVEGTQSALPNPNIDLYQKLQNYGIPIVFLHNYYRDLPCPAFVTDDKNTFYNLTNLLIKNGHTKIGGMFKLDDLQGHLRYEGYVKAMLDAGLPVCEDQVWWFSTQSSKSSLRYQLISDMQTIKQCTAIVCYNDQMVNQIHHILIEHQIRVPEDISIVGCDNQLEKLGSSLPLTTAEYPKMELGTVAANFLMEQITNNACVKEQNISTFPFCIIERGSIVDRHSSVKK